MEAMKLFPKGCKINIEVVFPGEYRIGYEWGGKKYVPGSGSYYDFDTALYKCWEALLTNHPAPNIEDDQMKPPEPNVVCKIVLFHDTKHIEGGHLTHLATFTCGFWRTLQGELIALHRDVKRWQSAGIELYESNKR